LKYAFREDGSMENQFHFLLDDEKDKEKPFSFSHNGKVTSSGITTQTNFRIYEFKPLSQFTPGYLPHLSVPNGDNLPSLLISNSELKKWVSDFLKSKGLMLTLKPTENDILVSKLMKDEIYSYPYFSLSETLQRIIFYILAIKTNKSAIILFDEPDSNTFPVYTKLLAERIAMDKTNQFFITTHNPYLLLSLIEKSKSEDLNICISRMKNHQTTLSTLDYNQISQVLDFRSDIFFNFEKILRA